MNVNNTKDINLILDKKKDAYTVDSSFLKSEELKKFLSSMFSIVDNYIEFSISNDFDRKKYICHLNELIKFLEDELGSNSKLVLDAKILLSNEKTDYYRNSNFWDDLLKLRPVYSAFQEKNDNTLEK